LISEILTLNHALNPHLEKHLTIPFRALNRKTRLEQFQLARALQKKGGQQFFSRDAQAMFGKA
jgi:hypothetical protein